MCEARISLRGGLALSQGQVVALIKIARNPDTTLTEDERSSLRSAAARPEMAASRAGVPIATPEGSHSPDQPGT